MKVLIVDDEPKIIQLITHLIDWHAYDMNIVGTACDGETALRSACGLKPDIILTDIRMPVIDGIELISKVHEAGLHPYFIIISGHSDFTYAQKAVQLGVEDYLLKPILAEDLKRSLTNIIGKYEDHCRTLSRESELITELRETKHRLKNDLLTDALIHNSFSLTDDSIREVSALYHCDFSGTYFCHLIAHLYTSVSEISVPAAEIYSFVLPRIQDMLRNCLSEGCPELLSIISGDEIHLLINGSEDELAESLSELSQMHIDLTNLKSIYPTIDLVIGVSDLFTSLHDLKAQSAAARDALSLRFSNSGMLLRAASVSDDDPDSRKGVDAELRKELSEAIALLDKERFSNVYDKILREVRGSIRNSRFIFSCYHEVIDLVLVGVRNLDSKVSISREDLLNGYSKIYGFDQLFGWLKHECETIIAAILTERRDIEDKPIRLAKQYINDHFSEPITLEMVSAYVGFNTAYFSTLFKKSTGQNFLDYLKEVRIDNARYLLQYTDHSMPEIIAMIGYSDIKYFTKIFRDKTHITPAEYKKIFGKNQS